jgi:hypothetical protein
MPVSPAIFSAQAMPSSSALCASIGPGITSPIAQMPGTGVRKSVIGLDLAALVDREPRLVEAEPSVFGRRPIETSTASASSVSASPPAAGSSVRTAFLPLTVGLGDLGGELEFDALLLEDAALPCGLRRPCRAGSGRELDAR